MLPELHAPIELCLPDGTHDPAAVGFTRRPLHRTHLTGWGRNKRWEYWGLVTPTHVLGLTMSSLDYAAMHQAYVLDRRTMRARETTRVVPLGLGVRLPDDGPPVFARARAPGLELDFRDVAEGTSL